MLYGDKFGSSNNLTIFAYNQLKPIPMKKKTRTKYVVITLQERNGEQEYSHRVAMAIPPNKDEWKVAESYASDFWGTDGKKNEYGWYEFFGGCIWVRARGMNYVTKKEYEVLNKFI